MNHKDMKKAIKFSVLTLLCLIVLSSVGGYFYFKRQFKAPPNQLTITGTNTTVSIWWVGTAQSERGAMLLPVQLGSVADTFYMQLDFGAVNTMLYAPAIASIAEHNPKSVVPGPWVKEVGLTVGKVQIWGDSVRSIDFGTPVEWDSDKPQIIGTLGADVLERCPMLVDFVEGTVHFLPQVPDSLHAHTNTIAFTMEERRVMVPVQLQGEERKMIWDTGSSAFQLLTNQRSWQKLAINPEDVEPTASNQRRRPLLVYTAACQETLRLGQTQLPLTQVTYIEGFPWYQTLLYRFSGMGGMLGNAIFAKRKVFLNANSGELVVF